MSVLKGRCYHHHLIIEISTMSILQGAPTITNLKWRLAPCQSCREPPPCYSSDLHHVCPAGGHHHHNLVVKIRHHVRSAVGHHHHHLVMDIRQQVLPAGGLRTPPSPPSEPIILAYSQDIVDQVQFTCQ